MPRFKFIVMAPSERPPSEIDKVGLLFEFFEDRDVRPLVADLVNHIGSGERFVECYPPGTTVEGDKVPLKIDVEKMRKYLEFDNDFLNFVFDNPSILSGIFRALITELNSFIDNGKFEFSGDYDALEASGVAGGDFELYRELGALEELIGYITDLKKLACIYCAELGMESLYLIVAVLSEKYQESVAPLLDQVLVENDELRAALIAGRIADEHGDMAEVFRAGVERALESDMFEAAVDAKAQLATNAQFAAVVGELASAKRSGRPIDAADIEISPFFEAREESARGHIDESNRQDIQEFLRILETYSNPVDLMKALLNFDALVELFED